MVNGAFCAGKTIMTDRGLPIKGDADQDKGRHMGRRNHLKFGALSLVALALAATPVQAQKAYGPGVTDTEIKLGTTTPFSGPASAYSAGAVSATAYFTMINEKGGINGRKINYVALDDGYSPPKTVEQTRKLIEGEDVLFLV